METRERAELAHAWEVVVHCGYFFWSIRRRHFAWFNRVVFEDLMQSGLWYPAGMNKDLFVKIFELNCWAIPRTAVGGGGSLVAPWVAAAGPSRAAHPSDSCGMVLIEIAAGFESPEVGSAIPTESIASLIWAAAWDEG